MYDIDGVNVTRRSPRVNGADITWPATAFGLKIVMVHETRIHDCAGNTRARRAHPTQLKTLGLLDCTLSTFGHAHIS